MKRKILAFVMAVTLSLSAVEVIPQLNDTIVAEAATVGLVVMRQTLATGWEFTHTVIGAKASKVKWKTANKKVAKVNAKGKIVAVGVGSTKITATYNKKKYTCNISVVEDMKADDFNFCEEGSDQLDSYIEWCEAGGNTSAYLEDLSLNEKNNRGIKEGSTYKQVIAKYGDNSNFEAIDSQDRFASSIETSTPIVYTHTYYYEAESGRSYNKTFYYDKGKKVVACLLCW